MPAHTGKSTLAVSLSVSLFKFAVKEVRKVGNGPIHTDGKALGGRETPREEIASTFLEYSRQMELGMRAATQQQQPKAL